MNNKQARIDSTIDAIRGSYGDKYSENHYEGFRQQCIRITSIKELISAVENWFDIDTADAKDMVRI